MVVKKIVAQISLKRDLTLPIPETLEKIRGFKSLTIYKMSKSPYYYVRMFEDGKMIRKSTKTTNRKEAIDFSEKFFVDIKYKILNQEPISTKSGFEVCSWGLQKENQARLERGELSQMKVDNDEYRLKKDLLPFFRNYELSQINYKVLNEFLQTLNDKEQGRDLSSNSLKIYLSHIKTILKFGQRMGVINSLPMFPSIKTVDSTRSWFNSSEYSKLHNTCRTHIGDVFEIKKVKSGEVYRRGVLTDELYDLIIFMTNTFIRPSDIRVLQHKHITIVRHPSVYLRLNHPATKGHSAPVVSLQGAIEVYERILKRQQAEGFGKENDYVFQPQHQNRTYVIQELHRQFDYLLKITNLKTSSNGEPRTLYSLRHTAIMFRLTESQGLDLLSLARNCRTSVEMIDRFYGKHLTGEMNIDIIQSSRSPVMQKINQDIEIRVQKKESREDISYKNIKKTVSSKKITKKSTPTKKTPRKTTSKTEKHT